MIALAASFVDIVLMSEESPVTASHPLLGEGLLQRDATATKKSAWYEYQWMTLGTSSSETLNCPVAGRVTAHTK